MTDRNKVVWSEGLFLRTQHLQQQDRHTDWLIRQVLGALPRHAFGFTKLELDTTALEEGQVAVAVAEGVLLLGMRLPTRWWSMSLRPDIMEGPWVAIPWFSSELWRTCWMPTCRDCSFSGPTGCTRAEWKYSMRATWPMYTAESPAYALRRGFGMFTDFPPC